jgi:hypothetical protein
MSVCRLARDERTHVLSALLRLLRGLRPRAGPRPTLWKIGKIFRQSGSFSGFALSALIGPE